MAEKEALKAAAKAYAAERGLPQDSFGWLFNTSNNLTKEQREKTRGAWAAIAASALPERAVRSVWMAGTRILHPNNYKACCPFPTTFPNAKSAHCGWQSFPASQGPQGVLLPFKSPGFVAKPETGLWRCASTVYRGRDFLDIQIIIPQSRGHIGNVLRRYEFS